MTILSMKKEIYVKLLSGWIKIKGKLRSPTKKSSKAIFSLIGESIDEPTDNEDEAIGTIYVSAYKITKYILKLLDEDIDGKIIVKPLTKETYEVTLYNSSNNTLNKLKRIAEEMKALKQPKKVS